MVITDAQYVLSPVTLVDVSQNALVPDMAVGVQNGKVSFIGKAASLPSSFASFIHHDGASLYLGPGFIDMHIHGAGGIDVTDPQHAEEDLLALSRYLLGQGITSFQLASYFDPLLFASLAPSFANPFIASMVRGVYSEGPFVSTLKKGGLPLSSLRAPSEEVLSEILSFVKGDGTSLVTMMTIAPELSDISKFYKPLQNSGIKIAFGHSNALLSQVPRIEGMHLTHLFNAMSGIVHRGNGLAASVFLKEFQSSTFELICDCVHVEKSAIEMVLDNLGTHRFCLISDAMKFAGMGEVKGVYASKPAFSDGRACYYAEDHMLIGSALLTSQSAAGLLSSAHLSLLDCFRVGSYNPARVLGWSDRGEIALGRKADFLLVDENLGVINVFKSL